MGRPDVGNKVDERQRRRFARALLDDLRALERMCDAGLIESDVRRIGAEQEMFLIEPDGRPAPIATKVLGGLADPGYTTELALFNIEFNLPARPLVARCLREIEDEVHEALERAGKAARAVGGDVVLAGILPTLERRDLGLDNITPLPRYYELNRVMTELSGGRFRTQIAGVDELNVEHDNVMMEACNTSFQIHFQVGAHEFARLYNLSQVVTAPVLAIAANSPLLLRQRLWRETRIALFEQSLDIRSDPQKLRGSRRRVSFGDSWVNESVVELFRDDIARFRVLLAGDLGEQSTELLDRGEIPPLNALRLHNGTIYRWNRPCVGVNDGVAHLRIENRALPAGPSVIDEVANAAFYFGLMSELAEQYGDVRSHFAFDDVKTNFLAAARYGLKTTLHWAEGETVPARELITERLIPAAREGLRRRDIDETDIERYLDVIAERAATGQTGAQWQLDAIGRLHGIGKPGARFQALTKSIADRQRTGEPVHRWKLPEEHDEPDIREGYRSVAQVMTTDLFTVHPEDVVDVAASVMHWEHLRHVPVEDSEGNLVGLVSHRSLLGMIARGGGSDDADPVAVREIMKTNPITATPETPCLDAIELMRSHRVGCLPIVQDGRLVGVVTERDFIEIAARLLEDHLRDEHEGQGMA